MSATPQATEAVIETSDGPMPAHVAVPSGIPKGGVIVVQEAFGVTDHIKDVATRFASAGWHALAPALFHRQGSPVLGYDNFEKVKPVMQSLTAAGITTDVLACYDHLERAGIPAPRMAIVGFCMGGSVAFYGATLTPIGAAVTFYGGGVSEGRFGLPPLIEMAPSLATPWLGLFGDEDHSIPVPDVERLREAAAGAPVDTEIVRYPDAGHGFHCDARPDAYAPGPARDAWGRTLAWLERYASGTPPTP